MDQQSSCSLKLAPKKKAQQRRAHAFSLIYFFVPFSIFYIPYNYDIPQAMPHAIPHTHSSFYPQRPRSVASSALKAGISLAILRDLGNTTVDNERLIIEKRS